ncbi:group XV phospholipase A2 [Tetranychus urticae]|uniref:Group XV phospholipase A2 n=1 Tax=Tetranychus urticae TaxID=32264 RepID=T1K8H2_TETUR|nr:group XV phospholipase A2 [Tetranychus urticae]
MWLPTNLKLNCIISTLLIYLIVYCDCRTANNLKIEKTETNIGLNGLWPSRRPSIHYMPLSSAALSPMVLIPGDGGSQLEAKIDKPDVVHYFCQKKSPDYFSLWLNLADLVPFVVDCWVDNMRLVYDNVTRKTSNSPGVDIRVPGFGNTTSVEYVDPSQVSVSGYYNQLVKVMVEMGYSRGNTILGAPYDFRKAPNEMEDFYNQFKTMIESSYTKLGKKLVLVCHSMGCPITLYFLNNQKQDWKDRHIRCLISLAGAWGGAVKSLKAFTSGDNLGVIVLPALKVRKDEQTFPSLAYLMPTDKFWPHDEVIMSTTELNVTTSNYKEFFDLVQNTDGYEMWRDVRNLTYELKPPGVEVHCLHGTGIDTMEYLDYRNVKFPDHQPKITFGPGDGTVNERSLKGCLRWQTQQTQPVFYKNFTKVDHMSILADPLVIAYIRTVVTAE